MFTRSLFCTFIYSEQEFNYMNMTKSISVTSFSILFHRETKEDISINIFADTFIDLFPNR